MYVKRDRETLRTDNLRETETETETKTKIKTETLRTSRTMRVIGFVRARNKRSVKPSENIRKGVSGVN